MTSEDFVENFYIERQLLVDLYFHTDTKSDVTQLIQSLNLDEEKTKVLRKILMATGISGN